MVCVTMVMTSICKKINYVQVISEYLSLEKNHRNFWGYILLHAFTMIRFFIFLLIHFSCLKELFAPWSCILQIPWPLFWMAPAVCGSFYSLFHNVFFLSFHFINLALTTSSLMFWSFDSTIQQWLILLFHFHIFLMWGNFIW